jgi:O-antigen ligase
MTSLAALPEIDRARWLRVVDLLAVGVAVTLPWSTTATGVFIALWILAVLPTLDRAAIRRELATSAGFLPVLLWLLAVAGMLWADVPWKERLGGMGGFHKLLVIPLLLVHFRRSKRGVWVLYGFFAGAAALLAVSFGQAAIPSLR